MIKMNIDASKCTVSCLPYSTSKENDAEMWEILEPFNSVQ